MTAADSVIRVAIVGDAKGLSRELATADKGIAGFAGSAKGLLTGAIAGGAAAALIGFADTALGEADRLGDATARLEEQVGDFAAGMVDAADQLSDLGLSAQDVLELEAAFADAATAVGLADDKIAALADDAAATAGAIALLTDMSPDEVIGLIGKAADGSEKAMKALGIQMTDAEVVARALTDTGKANAEALTDADLAAAGYSLVLEKLKPRLDSVAEGQKDVEQATGAVGAKFETLTGKIGAGLDGPLAALLDWILTGIEGWELFADNIELVIQLVKNMLGPVARLADALRGLIGLFGDVGRASVGLPDNPTRQYNPGGSSGNGSSTPNPDRAPVTIVVQPNSKSETEAAVVEAIREYESRNGRL